MGQAEEFELEAISARCEAATPGPWHSPLGTEWTIHSQLDGVIADIYNRSDGPFIAQARTDLPAALLEIERLRAIVEGRDAMLERVSWGRGGPPSALGDGAHRQEALGGEELKELTEDELGETIQRHLDGELAYLEIMVENTSPPAWMDHVASAAFEAGRQSGLDAIRGHRAGHYAKILESVEKQMRAMAGTFAEGTDFDSEAVTDPLATEVMTLRWVLKLLRGEI